MIITILDYFYFIFFWLSDNNLVPLYVLAPIIAIVMLIIVFLRLGIKRQKFKNLEHRLAEIEEEDENGEIDHYFVIRRQE